MKKFLVTLAILAIPVVAFAAYYGYYENTGEWKGNGTQSVRELVRLQSTLKRTDNKLRVSSMDYFLDIAEGHVPGHYAVTKFGHNDSVGSSIETIWSGSNIYPYLDSAQTLFVNGGANDDVGGTGALTVEIQGLDGNYESLTETIILTGATPVETTGSYLRIFRAKVLTAGSVGTNDADIEIYDDAIGTTLLCQIDAGYGQTLMAIWTVPAGSTAYLVKFYSATDAARSTETSLMVRPFGGAWNVKHNVHHLDGYFVHNFEIPIAVGEKADIEVQSMAAGVAPAMSAGFTLWYE